MNGSCANAGPLPDPSGRTGGMDAAGNGSGAAPPRISNLPASIGPLLRGRENFLERLHRALRTDSGAKAAAIIPPQAMHGLGGIGKTQAAIEYAHRHGAEHSALLLVRAGSAKELETSLADLTARGALNLPEDTEPEEKARLAAVLRWLDSHSGWLLIADGADTGEAAAAVEDFLERHGRGRALITARAGGWSGQVREFELEALEERDAVDLLLERSGHPRAPDGEGSVQALASRLEGWPLALELAGACIAGRGIGFARYLEIFDTCLGEVPPWHDPQGMRCPDSMAAACGASCAQLSPAARGLLGGLSFMDPGPIPCSVIEKSGTESWEALMELSRYALVRFPDEPRETFLIHRPVQAAARGRLGGNAVKVWGEAVELLFQEARTGPEETVWRRLAPHCAAVLSVTDSEDTCDSVLGLLESYCSFLVFDNADHEAAEPLHRRALKARGRIMGLESSLTLSSMSHHAALLAAMGDNAMAERLQRLALAMQERLLEPDHPEALATLGNLAELLHTKGGHAAAEPLCRRALEARERTLGPEHPDTLFSLGLLAVILQAKGDFAAAEPLYRRALEVWERLWGPEHPDTLACLGNFAGMLAAGGDYTAAEPLYRRTLDIQERTLGPEHPETLTSLSHLATVLHAKGDHAAAEPLYRRALDIHERALGPEHPHTLISLGNLAGILDARGGHEAAESLQRRALEAQERTLGPEHPDTVISLGWLAAILDGKGDFAAAESLYHQALEVMERVLGPEHPNTLAVLNNLTKLLEGRGTVRGRSRCTAGSRRHGSAGNPQEPPALSSGSNPAVPPMAAETSAEKRKSGSRLVSLLGNWFRRPF